MEQTVVGQQYEAEFQSDGVKGVRRKIAVGDYQEGKRNEAIKWLRHQNIEGKTHKAIKKQLALARRTARDARLTVILALIILFISILPWLQHLLSALR